MAKAVACVIRADSRCICQRFFAAGHIAGGPLSYHKMESMSRKEAAELIRISKRLQAKKKQRNVSWSGTSLLRLAGSFEGPEDLSERHDYYLTGGN
ncbi:MAG: hypothetical protein C4519_06315 [Desulfobacteraceae bacterium]|nr:MAG: hypothetical protein C4519_06315 [Desulfobacteraceae bacterium]